MTRNRGQPSSICCAADTLAGCWAVQRSPCVPPHARADQNGHAAEGKEQSERRDDNSQVGGAHRNVVIPASKEPGEQQDGATEAPTGCATRLQQANGEAESGILVENRSFCVILVEC